MSAINPQDFIAELLFCIEKTDLIKGKALLQYFVDIPENAQNRVLYELSKAPNDIAFQLLSHIGKLHLPNTTIKTRICQLIGEFPTKSTCAAII